MSQTENSPLLLEDFFNGKSTAHGQVMSRSGTVTRRFTVHIDSSWIGNVGTLKEEFEWSDGEKTSRVWTVKKTGESSYEGTAADIIGTAIGASLGHSFFWKYRMLVNTGKATCKIRFDDRLYKVGEKILLNESVMYWYGLRVGKILISFQKL
jgi:hypothetical protein